LKYSDFTTQVVCKQKTIINFIFHKTETYDAQH